MGNTQSAQREIIENGSDEPYDCNFINPKMKGVLAYKKGRQDSITSQLFPNRKTRHSPSSLGEAKRRTRAILPQSPSIFKKNYSLGEASAGAQGPDSVNKANAVSESEGHRANSNAASNSTENVKESMAEPSIKSGSGIVPVLFSPGPATPTVQPTKEDAVPPLEDNIEFHNRRSVVALKKNLQESEQASSRSRSTSSTNAAPGDDSIDIEQLGRLAELPVVVATAASAMTVNYPSTKFGHSYSDTEPESSDIDNISDNGYLQSRDIVLNQALLHNVIKRDMKRKRDNNNNMSTSNAIKQNAEKNDTFQNALQSKNDISGTANDVHNLKLHDAESCPKSGSSCAPNTVSFSCNNIESGYLQGIKKLKPIGDETLLHSSPVDKNFPSVLEQHCKNSYSTDSFEKGSVEHREVKENNQYSPFSASSSPLSSSSFEPSRRSENVHVAIKWRDELPDGSPNKMNMISEDIASTLRLENPKSSFSNIFPMVHDANSQEWVVPDLVLPAGIYRLQFLIDGELRHSNYLPTATDSVGNFVNWFEVIPGYEEVEPYRDEVEMDSKWFSSSEDRMGSDSALSVRNQGSQETVPGKSSRRPPLVSLHSSNRVPKSNMPYLDYTGVSRSSSMLRKSRSPINYTNSSLDVRTALQPKKFKYTNEIPELFKTTPLPSSHDRDLSSKQEDPLLCDWNNLVSTPSPTNKVVDCNQDKLFTKLQQGGLFNGEMAERFFLDKYPVPDLPVYLNSFYLNRILTEFQRNSYSSNEVGGINHIIPHVNLNHLLTSSIRDEMISVGCTTRYEGKFITQVIYAPCYYENLRTVH